jgi:hypothetical protein
LELELRLKTLCSEGALSQHTFHPSSSHPRPTDLAKAAIAQRIAKAIRPLAFGTTIERSVNIYKSWYDSSKNARL